MNQNYITNTDPVDIIVRLPLIFGYIAFINNNSFNCLRYYIHKPCTFFYARFKVLFHISPARELLIWVLYALVFLQSCFFILCQRISIGYTCEVKDVHFSTRILYFWNHVCILFGVRPHRPPGTWSHLRPFHILRSKINKLFQDFLCSSASTIPSIKLNLPTILSTYSPRPKQMLGTSFFHQTIFVFSPIFGVSDTILVYTFFVIWLIKVFLLISG